MPHAIQFPRDIAAKLRRRFTTTGSWKLLRDEEKHGSSSRAKKRRAHIELVAPLASCEATREILDIAYVSSLMEEERRPIQLTLGYLSPKGAARLGFVVLLFKRPLPLRPAALASVALSTTPETATLGVWPSASGELQVWGLIHHGKQTFAIDRRHQPTYLSVRIIRPGTFTVHFDQRLALLFSRDHCHFFDKRFDLLGTLRDRAKLGPEVAQDLCRLAQRMLAHGHGGTILIVDDKTPAVGLKMDPSLTVARGAHRVLKDAMDLDERARSGEIERKKLTDAQYGRMRLEIENAHDEALDFVAHLTAIDGALVMRTDLSILGFGATILMPARAVPSEVIHEDPRSPRRKSTLLLSTLGGNRHRSAVSFCAQQEGFGLALVASQDGDLSLIGRRGDGFVHVIRPFELGVGI